MIALSLLLGILPLFDGESAPKAEPPTPVIQSIEGVATWYDYHPGQAAAGPALRAWLGKNWRGQKVTVTATGVTLIVTLTDWCQCEYKMPGERAIDLDYHDFARLASPTRGILKVTMSRPSELMGQ